MDIGFESSHCGECPQQGVFVRRYCLVAKGPLCPLQNAIIQLFFFNSPCLKTRVISLIFGGLDPYVIKTVEPKTLCRFLSEQEYKNIKNLTTTRALTI